MNKINSSKILLLNNEVCKRQHKSGKNLAKIIKKKKIEHATNTDANSSIVSFPNFS